MSVSFSRSFLDTLKLFGYICICVTNQPDWARGNRSLANIEAMNAKVAARLPLDDLYVCFHDRGDNCVCRKPKPGMLLAAAAKWNIDCSASWMIGDRAGDVGSATGPAMWGRAGLEINKRFYEIGSPGGLEELEDLMRRAENHEHS